MKWSIAGLAVLGFVAALSAAMLMTLFAGRRGAGGTGPVDNEVTILVAAHDLPATAMVDSSALEVRKVARDKVPANAVTTPVEAVGKILKGSMTSGQAFDKTMFVTEGSAQLAGSLAPGKRAMAISLTDFAGLDGVLYPGSVVDVVLTVNGSGTNLKAASRTVLEGIEVLAIERQTIVAKDAEKQSDASERRGQNARRVTLLVTSEQAAQLSLASSAGVLSLALRNPLDKQAAYSAPILLASLMPSYERTAVAVADARASGPAVPAAAVFDDETEKQAAKTSAAKPAWETRIIRGTTSETVEFPTDVEAPNVAKDSN